MTANSPPYLIILDTEFTSWKGAYETGWGEDWQHREIIQIAGIKVSLPDFACTESISIFVKPKINPVLSDYIKALTGIRQMDIDENGLFFSKALDTFLAYAKPEQNLMLSYGPEWMIFQENCALHDIDCPVTPQNLLNIRDYLPLMGIDDDAYTSGTLHKAAGIDMNGQAHNALFDVKSIQAALAKWHAEEKLPSAFYAALGIKLPCPQES